MSILERYLARAIVGGSLGALGVLVALSAFVLFVGQTDNVGKGSYTIPKALLFVLASMPQQAYEMFPMAVLMGALLSLGQLAAGNELTVIRASGVSVWRLARALGLGALFLAGTCLAVGELLAPSAERFALALKSNAINQRLTLVDRQGVWAKDGDTFVNVRQMRSDAQLGGVYMYQFDTAGRLVRATHAAGATRTGERWELRDVRETILTPDRSSVAGDPTRGWKSILDPELLDSFIVDYGSLSFVALSRYVDYLRENRLDSGDVEIYLWKRVAQPLDVMLLVMLALPFAFGPLRATGAGQRMVVGIMIGIAFYAASQTLLHSGTVYGLSPFLTNFLPTTILALATGISLARVR